MKILIRVDASKLMGTGHVMRCLVLATELKKSHAVTFLMRELDGNLISHVKSCGFDVLALQSPQEKKDTYDLPHSHWLVSSQEDDLRESLSTAGRQWDWVVVDHYGIDERWLSAWKPSKVLVVDDLADRKLWCDILVDQNDINPQTKRYQGLVPSSAKLLLGSQYAMLREEFRLFRREKPREKIEKALVFMGGADLNNATGKVLKALSPTTLEVKAIVGILNSHYTELVKEHGQRFTIQRGTDEMAKELSRADLVIGAGGVNTWERFCMGCVSVVLSIASNQEQIARNLDDAGAQIYLGRDLDFNSERLATILSQLKDPTYCRQLSEKGFSMVDGLGGTRIVKEMESDGAN